MTNSGTALLERNDTQQGNAEAAHIIKTEPGENAAAKVFEARIYGYEVEALCGHRFVPENDPSKKEICQKCKEAYEEIRDFEKMMFPDSDLSERPVE